MIVGAEASKIRILSIITVPDLTWRGFFGDIGSRTAGSAGPTAIRVCHTPTIYVLGLDTTNLP